MTRGRSIAAVLVAALAAAVAVVGWASWPEPPPEVVVGKPGFFHLEKRRGTWWFVDPDGEPFVSIGINHIGPEYLLTSSNRAATLAKYGAGFAGPDGGADWKSPEVAAWAREARAQVRTWGFNTLGWHNHLEQSEMPYVRGFRAALIDGWVGAKRWPDPWDPATRAQVDARAAEVVAPSADDPLVLGVGFNDVVTWQVRPGEHHPWQLAILRLPPKAPGKQQWIAFLKDRYPSAQLAADAYAVVATTWEELAAVREWPPPKAPKRVHEDALVFVPRIARTWYTLVTAIVRKHDPNHLVFGDKINGDPALPEWIEPIVADLWDVGFIEWRARFPEQRERLLRFHEHTGKPVLLGDSGFTVATAINPNPKRIVVASSEEVGREYALYLEEAVREPWVLGWHHCGYIMGTPDLAPRSEMMARQYGFLDPDGTPHEAEVRSATEANTKAFGWHLDGPEPR